MVKVCCGIEEYIPNSCQVGPNPPHTLPKASRPLSLIISYFILIYHFFLLFILFYENDFHIDILA